MPRHWQSMAGVQARAAGPHRREPASDEVARAAGKCLADWQPLKKSLTGTTSCRTSGPFSPAEQASYPVMANAPLRQTVESSDASHDRERFWPQSSSARDRGLSAVIPPTHRKEGYSWWNETL